MGPSWVTTGSRVNPKNTQLKKINSAAIEKCKIKEVG
jgi:hypothetical protein